MGLAVLAVLLVVAGLGLYAMGRRRRSGLPPVVPMPETEEVTGRTEPGEALVDGEPPSDARS
jgi:uncharacterized membrane protein